jgi:hypothetical protein
LSVVELLLEGMLAIVPTDAMTPTELKQLARPWIYGYPEPPEPDVLWVGRHTLHEGEHNLLDIDRQLNLAG